VTTKGVPRTRIAARPRATSSSDGDVSSEPLWPANMRQSSALPVPPPAPTAPTTPTAPTIASRPPALLSVASRRATTRCSSLTMALPSAVPSFKSTRRPRYRIRPEPAHSTSTVTTFEGDMASPSASRLSVAAVGIAKQPTRRCLAGSKNGDRNQPCSTASSASCNSPSLSSPPRAPASSWPAAAATARESDIGTHAGAAAACQQRVECRSRRSCTGAKINLSTIREEVVVLWRQRVVGDPSRDPRGGLAVTHTIETP
jgi:hypothetical protein